MGYEEHPRCVTPPDDTVVWRYIDFVKLIDLLENSRLWFTRVDSLDDPREGGLTDLELKQLQCAPPEVAEHNRYVFESSRREIFVNCWTENYESMAMWDLYAQTPGSVAVKSTVGQLKRALAGADSKFHIARVEYLDWNTAPWPNNILVMSVRKVWSFIHEKEVRLITWLPASSMPAIQEARALTNLENAIREPLRACAPSDQQTWKRILNSARDDASLERALPGFPIKTEAAGLIEEVIVGPRGRKWKELVENILRRYDIDKPVRQSELTYSQNRVVDR